MPEGLAIRPDTLMCGLAGAAMLIATAALVGGWGLGLDRLVRVQPGFAAMVPSTATLIMLVAGAQITRCRHAPLHRAAMVILAGVIAWSAVRLGVALVEQLDDLHQDRMSVASSIGLMMAAAGTLATFHPSRWAVRLQVGLGLIGAALSATALLGYLYDAPALYEFFVLSATAVHTALALLLLFLALLVQRDLSGFLSALLGDTPSSLTGRRLLPLAVLGPLGLTWGAVQLIEALGVPSGVARGLFSLLVICFTCLLVLVGVRAATRERRASQSMMTRLQQTLDGLDVAAFVIAPEGTGSTANRRALDLSGGDPQGWLFGTAFHDVVSRAPLIGAAHPARRLAAGEPDVRLHLAWVDRSGTEQALRFSGHALGEGMGTLVTVIDETEVVRIRSNLMQIERVEAVRHIAGGVAHEMGNFLGAIRLSTDIALRLSDPQQVRDELEAIQRACQRGTALTTKMLDLTRETESEPQRINALDTLSEIRALSRSSLSDGVALDVHVAEPELSLWVDPVALEATLLNLVLNADHAFVEAGRGGGRIDVTAQAAGEMIEIEVRDDGPGMSSDVLSRARQPFFTTRSGSGGSGLGLSLAESFVQRAGGSMTLSSTLGEGTTVRLLLPCEPGPLDQSVDLSGCRVVLADGDPVDRMRLHEKLVLRGADTQEAVTPEEVCAALGTERPDILLISEPLAFGAIKAGCDLGAFARHGGMVTLTSDGIAAPDWSLSGEEWQESSVAAVSEGDQSGAAQGAHRGHGQHGHHRGGLPGLVLRKPVTERSLDATMRLLHARLTGKGTGERHPPVTPEDDNCLSQKDRV